MYKAVSRTKIIFIMVALIPSTIMLCGRGFAQESLESGKVAPIGEWLEYTEIEFAGQPILVHLRTGYERPIIFPEPVLQSDETQTLPGTEIIVDGNIVAFYPTITFSRSPVVFVGLETGTVYDVRVRASTEGIRQPMRINR